MKSLTSVRGRSLAYLCAGVAATAVGLVALGHPAARAADAPAGCSGDNGGLSLSPGFCASVVADNLGHLRHLALGADGTIYANTWSGQYYVGSPPPAGGFLVAIKPKGDAKADIARFGQTAADGVAGGTGVAVYKGYVYAEVNDKIVRYKLPAGGSVPEGKTPEVVLSGMPLGGNHPMHPFVIDPKGQIFVDMGTATNACQGEEGDRKPGGSRPPWGCGRCPWDHCTVKTRPGRAVGRRAPYHLICCDAKAMRPKTSRPGSTPIDARRHFLKHWLRPR
ncbi:MAG: hypothetical protein WDN45_19175 [Caulobacteraceae bacterium]